MSKVLVVQTQGPEFGFPAPRGKKKKKKSWARQHIPVIPALGDRDTRTLAVHGPASLASLATELWVQ